MLGMQQRVYQIFEISDTPAVATPSFDAYSSGGIPNRPRLHSASCTLLAWRNLTIQCVFAVAIMIACAGEPHSLVIRVTTQTSCANSSPFPVSLFSTAVSNSVSDDASSNSLHSLHFPASLLRLRTHIRKNLIC